jgi:transposase
MSHTRTRTHFVAMPNVTIGLDLGDRTSRTCEMAADGRCLREAALSTTLVGVRQYFGGRERARVVLEVGTHSPWVSRVLAELGHEVIVANPSAMFAGKPRRRRNDQLDAAFLARQGRADPTLLSPITHRTAQAQQHLEALRARDQLVAVRTKLINHVRGVVKALGGRLPRCSAEAFPARAAGVLPVEVAPALTPLLEVCTDLTRRIAHADRQVDTIANTHYPVTTRLRQPAGVGPLTALAFVLLVEDPTRFRTSRDVGPYFGLVPRLDDSGTATPQLRISKAGDAFGRRLLVSAAQYILGPFGPECDLRRHGEALARRGGRNAKKRAVIAVARKLSVLLHRLWVSDQPYDPDYQRRHHRPDPLHDLPDHRTARWQHQPA